MGQYFVTALSSLCSIENVALLGGLDMANFCNNCGANVSESAKFCNNCGNPITNSMKPPEPLDSDYKEIRAGSKTANVGTVDNRYAWGIVGVVFVVFIAMQFIDNLMAIIGSVASSTLAQKDAVSIAAYEGVEPDKKELFHSGLWGFLLPVVYLWKRAAKIGDKKRLQFWAYIGALIICVLVGSVMLRSSTYNEAIVAAVNEIIDDNSLGNARCVSVTRIRKLSDNHHTYKVFMNNEKAFDVEVTLTNDGRIWVEIPSTGLLQAQGYFRK